MELVIEHAEGIPEGGILSLKIGESKRQGPASKLGSLFRFGAVPPAPLNVKVELLTPAAPPQLLALDPETGRCAVDFGGGTAVTLGHREISELRRPKVDVDKIVESRKLPSEKLHMAQSAAKYLEDHDIVHTFQDILHGLLLDKPEDPFSFIDEHLARARSLASHRPCREEQRIRQTAKGFVKDAVERALAKQGDAARVAEAREITDPGKNAPSNDVILGAVHAANAETTAVGEELREGAGDNVQQSAHLAGCYSASHLGDSAALSSTSQALSSEGGLLDGTWLEGAQVHVICGREMRWANGICTDIEMTGDSSFSVALYGKLYEAHLEDEGQVLRWCDGDIWQRAGGKPGDCQPIQVNKVEALLGSMHSLKRSLPLVLPALPLELREQLADPTLSEECQQRFNELDQSHRGKLSPEDLMPMVGAMSSARRQSITPEQCQRFASIFDVNQDGVIEQREFAGLMRFSLIARYLESDEGQEVATMVQKEDRLFQDFLRTLEQDLQLMDEVLPLLPRWLQDHLASEEFRAAWLEHFDRLDRDKKEALDPMDLLPEVLRLSEAHPLTIDLHKCRQFAAIFDKRKDGVIRRDEWLELAKFLSVMCYLGGEEVEQDVQVEPLLERRSQLPRKRVQELLVMLEDGHNRLSEVIPFLPEWLKSDIMSDSFVEACLDAAQGLDQNGEGQFDPSDLFPLVAKLCEAWAFPITGEECLRFTALFDGDGERNGAVHLDEAVEFARFIIIMGFLKTSHESKQPSSVITESAQLSKESCSSKSTGLDRAEQLLRALQADAEKLGEVVAFLPMRVKAPLLTAAFAEECLAAFDGLDRGARGALAPEELIAPVARLGRSWSFAVAEDQCLQFLDLLSTQHSTSIRRGEFVSFVQFMLALAYFETEEGQVAAAEAQLALGRRRVEELLAMLERDRLSVHKVVPLVPPGLAEHLASEAFAQTSGRHFAGLDAGGLGYLRPSDLVPLVAELSLAQQTAVDENACSRFLAIFNARHDGVMYEGDFLELSRFLCIMSFLHSEEGRALVQEGIHLMDSSFKVNDLLAILRTDRQTLQLALRYLPGWLQSELQGEHFVTTCLELFEELDVSKRGLLENSQLFKFVMESSVARRLGLDETQCARFSAVYSDRDTGVITKADCPDFVCFLLVLAFLESQDGQKKLEMHQWEQHGASTTPVTPPADNLGVALFARRISADLEHYRTRAERLELENEAQREHIERMEAALEQHGLQGEAHDYHDDRSDLNFGAMQVPVG